MSASVLAKRNSSPYQTHRTPIRDDDDDIQNNNQRQSNRRSLSGRFRSLFRKNSASPTRSTVNNGRSNPLSSRQRSPSPESFRTATEAPHLRAPIISWPFGRKKTKDNRKKTKSPVSSTEISSPVYQQEHQTSIRGQNFIPRTPEVTHNGAGRIQSSSSYETKGFRDYTIIDNTKPIQQVIAPDLDVITPPPYVSDQSRSPSLNHQRFFDTNIEHAYHNDNAQQISDIEIIPIPKQEQHLVGDMPLLNTTQILIEQSPLLSRKVTQPMNISTNSNQWTNPSYSSINNSEIRSRTPPLKDVDAPKLHAPLMSLSSNTSNKSKSKRISFEPRYDDTYNSTSTINDFIPSNQSYTKTYGSLTDTQNGSIKPILTNSNPYPGLNAIVEYHIRPTLGQFSPHSSMKTNISPNQTQRFDASTTTFNDFGQRQQWSPTVIKGLPSSPASIHRHDGYIRPLTPEKTSIQPDVNVIHVNLDDLRSQSSPRTSHYQSTSSPVMYRSSTTIYTKDKHNYTDGGGQLRTWSARKTGDIDDSRIASTTYQIIPLKINHKQEEGNRYEYEREYQPQYSINRYSDSIINSNLTRSSILNERDKIYDQSTRSYKDYEYIQEPIKSITPVKYSEVALRHYTLKRTDSYDGLGIVISADAETHLNHRIREIENGSPGSRLGLRKNDRIVKVNGVNIENIEFGDVLLLIKQGLTNNNLQFAVINESIFL